MPIRSGQRLWNRKHLVLEVGENIVPHGLTQLRRNIDPQFAPAVQIIPLPPLDAWAGVQLGAQPDSENVMFIVPDTGGKTGKPEQVELDVLFWEPHTVVGPGDADEYIIEQYVPPEPIEPIDVCGSGDCDSPIAIRVAKKMVKSARGAQLLARFAPLLAARVTTRL
jgi:hypothetical protein